ncbi:resolvase [Paracoccus sp. (in: a-proteobacteria)]|uniref:resolvase n=1 Tax=Paracoccus sp. TaxID=267 RepID=UPI00272D6E6C|nr:resolvase [Paracoccus sp. (in: a-proteobacteria)]
MTDEIDLFGNPVRPGRGQRGRPRFEVTPEIRNKIKLGLALGWVNDRIAGAVGISAATLKRYFRAELKARDLARDQLDLRRFELVMAEANKGNVGAIKELGKMLERNDQMTAGRRFEAAQEQPARDKPTKALGKKEAAQLAAENAGGEGSLWGSDLTPGWRPN